MSDFESQIADIMARVRGAVGDFDGDQQKTGPRCDFHKPAPRPAVVVAPAPRAAVACAGGDHEAAFLGEVAPRAVLAVRFSAPVVRQLARREYRVFSLWEFHGVRVACALNAAGEVVKDAAIINKLARLCADVQI